MKKFSALAFCLLFIIICFPHSMAFSAYFKGLGKLPGDTGSYAFEVSPDGNFVVGGSEGDSALAEAFRWTESQGMVGLGFISGYSESTATGVSQNGAVVIGTGINPSPFKYQAFRWTESGGMIGLGFFDWYTNSEATAISDNGSVIVGSCTGSSGGGFQAFRWTESGGMAGLGFLSDDFSSSANAVSSDGSIVVGSSGVTVERAFKWTESTKMVALPMPAGDFNVSRAYGVSGDGSIIVGVIGSDPSLIFQAARWDTLNNEILILGDLPGGYQYSEAYAVSDDGSVIIGAGSTASGDEAFIYDQVNGLRNLKEVLTNQYGLNLTGWTLTGAIAISSDGKTIVGYGTNPAGDTEGWIANLGTQIDSGGNTGGNTGGGGNSGGTTPSGGGGGGGGGCFIGAVLP